MRATYQLVVDDDPHTDAGPDGDEHHRRDPSRQPEPLLADGGEVDVVLDQHGHIEAIADHLDRIEPALGRDVVRERGDPATA